MELIAPVIDRGVSVRIYYRAVDCGVLNHGALVHLPALVLTPPRTGERGADAIRRIFSQEAGVSVSERGASVLDIRIGNPRDDILKTKIRRVVMRREESYRANDTIFAIERAGEVEASETRLGVKRPTTVEIGPVRRPQPSDPHLPNSIENVTFDQALDVVAAKFQGVVFFGMCEQPPLYDIDFRHVGRH